MRAFNVLRFPEFYGGQMGVPRSSSALGLRLHPDAVDFYVDSGHTEATDTPDGGSPDAPYATLDYAIGRCTANRGDVIYVSQGHAETVAAAGGIDLDVAGITVKGLGQGDIRPTITFSATGSTIAVGAADISIHGLRFISGIDAVVVMIDVNADDFWIDDCEFPEVAAMQVVSFIDVDGGGANACDGFTMTGCTIRQATAGADQAVDIAQVQDRIVIADNVIDGDFVNAGLYSPAIFTNALIARNVVYNRQAGDHAIEFTAAGTGELVDNRLVGDTLGTILDPGSMMCLGNLETDAIDQSGVPTPRTAAGGAPAGWIDVSSFATDISMWQLDTTTSATPLTSGTIFTYTGSIEFYVIGRVSTVIQAQATTCQLTVTADALAAYAICATVDINAFDAGSILSITGTAAGAMVGTDAQGVIAPGQVAPVYATCVTSGVITTAFGAASTGAIVWELLWRPLSAGATVT